MTPIDEELWFDSEGNDEETEAKAAESMAAMVGRILGAKPFPVAVCHKPSFGNTCPRCAGYVCSVHQIGPRDFCAQCLREYSDTVAGRSMSARARILSGAGIAAVASASVIGVALSGTDDAPAARSRA